MSSTKIATRSIITVHVRAKHILQDQEYKHIKCWWNWSLIMWFLMSYQNWVNSSLPGATIYMNWWTGSALVQIMACHIVSANPLLESIIDLLSIGPLGTNFIEICIETQNLLGNSFETVVCEMVVILAKGRWVNCPCACCATDNNNVCMCTHLMGSIEVTSISTPFSIHTYKNCMPYMLTDPNIMTHDIKNRQVICDLRWWLPCQYSLFSCFAIFFYIYQNNWQMLLQFS